ncbi:MAG: IS1634 family transposase [Chlamydiota bacterium]
MRYDRLIDTEIAIKKSKKRRPGPEDTVEVSYHLQARIVEDKGKIEEKSAFLGRVIIATNELNAEKLSSQEMLVNYKEQQRLERGFRFLKDASFMTSSVFLKKQKKIIAPGMVMCLCLLVYTIAQRQIRRQKQVKQYGAKRENPHKNRVYNGFSRCLREFMFSSKKPMVKALRLY